MKKYIVVIKQSDEGCGYTIGCAQKAIELYAKDITEAYERFALMIGPFDDEDVDWTEDYGGYYGERALESAVIYEVAHESYVNLNEIYANLRIADMKKEEVRIEESEKREFERLKKKYK